MTTEPSGVNAAALAELAGARHLRLRAPVSALGLVSPRTVAAPRKSRSATVD
jgi:hypothetical protein